MGQQQSKDELLYENALNGNIEAVKSLRTEGAGLEWIDKEGKTPLIVACMVPERFIVATTLIELGANVNAYRPGLHAGTPLHHAAKRGLDHTVRLLLSHGAKPLDSQPRTVVALWKADIEAAKFHQSDPTLIIFDKSTKTRHKFASASDSDKQQFQLLYNACKGIPQVMSSPVPHDTQTSAQITESQTAAQAVELAMGINASIQSAMEDRLQFRPNNHANSEANNVNGWGDTPNDNSQNGWGSFGGSPPPEASSSGWMDKPTREEYNGWGVPESMPTNNPIQATHIPSRAEHNGWGVAESTATNNSIQTTHLPHNIPPPVQTTNAVPVLASPAPSAPPVPLEGLYDGPIHYPSIDFSPVDLVVPCVEHDASRTSEAKDGDCSSSCVICWEAPVEGACIPCGHMAGCMSCLNEIKTKKGDCPVCRAKINQVIRLYAV